MNANVYNIRAEAAQHPLIITASVVKGGGVINITDAIGSDTKASAMTVSSAVDKLIAAGMNTATVYLNSGGGSTFEATEIANALSRFPNAPKIEVGALAASAASYLCAKFYTIAQANSRFMLHKPMLGIRGNEDQIAAGQKMLKDVTAEYREAYAKKFNKTNDEIEAMWAKGDVWLTAAEAKAMGLVDEIKGGEAKVDKLTAAWLAECGCPTASLPKINVKSETVDKEKLIQLLGLPADATDEQIEKALQEMKDKAAAAEDGETPPTEEEAKAAKAAALVAKAITDKKITADKKDQYETLAVADYDTVEKLFAGMKAAKPMAAPAQNGSRSTSDHTKDWTLEDFLEKDPEALAKMEDENPDRFASLNAAYFKSTKK